VKKKQEQKVSQRTSPLYNTLPKKVSRAEFKKYIEPYLSWGKRGPKLSIPRYVLFNFILYVLHTGIQWNQLPTAGKIFWSNVYRHHNHWSKDGSYQKMFLHSVVFLKEKGLLDLSVLHGDGTNTIAKKGAKE
jgi:transposase